MTTPTTPTTPTTTNTPKPIISPIENLNDQILEKLNSNPDDIPEYLKSIWLADEEDNESFYDEYLEVCLRIIAGTKDPNEFFKDLANSKLLNVGACETTWSYGDTAYKCKTCQLDPTSALCINCFQAGDHEGHDYALQSVGGGFCDCGDPTAFKPQGFCSKHKEQVIDVTKYPIRFIKALCFIVQDILKHIYEFFENQDARFDPFIDWILKLSQKGDIIKVIVIKYVSNTDIGNTNLLIQSQFPTPLIQKFYLPKNHNVSRDARDKIINFCVFLRGSVEFIQTFIRVLLPIYKDSLLNCKDHILLDSYSIFSSTAMSELLLQENAAEIVMDTINEYFHRFFINRDQLYRRKRDRNTSPYQYPQYKMVSDPTIFKIRRVLHVLRNDIGFIISNPQVSSSIINNQVLLSLWFNMIGIAQGMNPNVTHHSTSVDDWNPAFKVDISFSNTIFSIVNSVPIFKSELDRLIFLSTQYLGKWILGWLESRNQYLLKKKQQLLQEKEEKEKDKDSNNEVKEKEKDKSITSSTSNSNLIKLDEQNFLKNIQIILDSYMKREGFTFHIPLHRVVSSLLNKAISQLGQEYKNYGGLKQLFSQIIGGDSLISIVDYARASTFHPFKILSSLGEIKSGMWKKNAREEDMSSQAIVYQSLHYQKYFDLDVYLVQIGSMLMDSNQFIHHAINIYNLKSWFKIESLNLLKSSSDQIPTTPSKNLRQSSGTIRTTTTTGTTTTTDSNNNNNQNQNENEEKKKTYT